MFFDYVTWIIAKSLFDNLLQKKTKRLTEKAFLTTIKCSYYI